MTPYQPKSQARKIENDVFQGFHSPNKNIDDNNDIDIFINRYMDTTVIE